MNAKIATLTPRDAQRAEAVKTLFRLAAGGAGVGMFGRGLMHLLQPQTQLDVPFVSPGPSVLPIPVSAEPSPKKGQGGLAKFAAELEKDALFDDQSLANGYRAFAENMPFEPTGLGKLVSTNVTNPQHAPMMMPMSLGAAAAGTAGGWSLADWLLKRRRKSHVDAQMQAAKDDFQQALLEQSQAAQAARGIKRAAAAQTLGERLDVLFDALQEQSVENVAAVKAAGLADAVAPVGGMYLTMLGLLSGGSAYGMYNWTKNRSKAHLLQKALQERSRNLLARSPQTVSLVPMTEHPPEEQPVAA
jgi:hypothetical protein